MIIVSVYHYTVHIYPKLVERYANISEMMICMYNVQVNYAQ